MVDSVVFFVLTGILFAIFLRILFHDLGIVIIVLFFAFIIMVLIIITLKDLLNKKDNKSPFDGSLDNQKNLICTKNIDFPEGYLMLNKHSYNTFTQEHFLKRFDGYAIIDNCKLNDCKTNPLLIIEYGNTEFYLIKESEVIAMVEYLKTNKKK